MVRKARRCEHCGYSPAERTWDMRPCAVGAHTTHHLCDPCDLILNRQVLEFFNVPQREELLTAYAEGNE